MSRIRYILIQRNVRDAKANKSYEWFYDFENDFLYRIDEKKVKRLNNKPKNLNSSGIYFVLGFFLLALSLSIMSNHFSDDTESNLLIGLLLVLLSFYLLYISFAIEEDQTYSRMAIYSQRLIARKSDIYKMYLNNKDRHMPYLLIMVLALGMLFFCYLTRELPGGRGRHSLSSIRLLTIIMCVSTVVYNCMHIYSCIRFRIKTKDKNELCKENKVIISPVIKKHLS